MTTKKILLIVGGVVVVLALVGAAFIGGIIALAIYKIGNSEAAAKAKDYLRQNEQLRRDIGEVEDFGAIITGSMNLANDSGEATLNLKVIGARETVNASVQLIFTRGSAWRVSSASYVNKEGQTIGLLDPYDSKLLTPEQKSQSPVFFAPTRLWGKFS